VSDFDKDRRTDPLESRVFNLGSDYACPECKTIGSVIGYLLLDSETGQHQHTRYACTAWVNSGVPTHLRKFGNHEDWGKVCDWRGWRLKRRRGYANDPHAVAMAPGAERPGDGDLGGNQEDLA
jgi:hypothetical protein